MTNKHIPDLTAATTPLAGTELVPIWDGTITKKATVDQILSPAAGNGVDFSANAPAAGMTSQVLDWYEEGTWTPTLTTSGTNFASVSYFPGAVNGSYTRIGNLVTIQGSMRTTAIIVGAASGNLRIGGLPFTAASIAFSDSVVGIGSASGFNTNQPSTGIVVGATTQIELVYRATANGATAVMGFGEANTGYNVNFLEFSATYRV